MSPLFGKHEGSNEDEGTDGGQLPRVIQLGAQLDDTVKHIATIPLEQLAAQVMTQFFSAAYEPGGGDVGTGDIADGLMPPHDYAKFGDPTPDAARALEDLAAEAVQLLEHAGLVRPKMYYGGGVVNFAYVATRRGRSAVEQNSVERILGAGGS
jgi:hypothetical protein